MVEASLLLNPSGLLKSRRSPRTQLASTRMFHFGSTSMKNILSGAKVGAVFGLLYCLVAVGIFAVQGNEPFEHNQVTLPAVLALYLCSGILAGAIVGALKPLTRTKPGAMLVGLVAVTPLA